MSDYTDPRVTDEATGLPPLEEPDPNDCILVAAWAGGIGVVQAPGDDAPVAVRFLHVRGLVRGDPKNPQLVSWGQVHLAVPVEYAVDVSVALASGGALDDDGGTPEQT
jgi:hypothetical protein